LRQLREQLALSPAQVQRKLGMDRSKTSRIEKGRLAVKREQALALLDLYGVTDPDHVAEFLSLVELCHRPEWWKAWSDAAADFVQPLLALEGAAEVVRTYENFYVPGLLQVPEYTCAVIRSEHPGLLPNKVMSRAELRDARKKHLDEPGGVTLWAIIDESVLHHDFGSPEVLRAQIAYLIRRAQHPSITLQIAPTSATRRVSLSHNVTLLHFAQKDLASVVYIEHLTTSHFSDKPDDAETYQAQLDKLAMYALTPEETVEVLERRLAELAG
ncbi:helix-turn-helix domain-containing protein, partial [Streptomyces coeruleoprunus]